MEEGMDDNPLKRNPFDHLPEELSVRVLRELHAETLVTASAVCTQWLVLCEDEGLWRWNCMRGNSSHEWRELLASYKEKSDKSWKQIYVDCVRFFPESVVLNADMMSQLSAWLKGNRTWKLIYRASVHGFNSKTFHKRCDKKGPTVTVCRTEKGYILGGYNPYSWDIWMPTERPLAPPDQPFIFTLTNPKAVEPHTYRYKGNETGVVNNANYGPMWGEQTKHDLGVYGYPHNKGRWSWTRLGSFYHSSFLEGIEKEDEKHSFLAGEPHFLVDEVEVFAVDQERTLKEMRPEKRKSVFASLVSRLRGSKRTLEETASKK